MESHPRMFLEYWKTEGVFWHKQQVIHSINQGSDGNRTEIRRSKVTNLDYNTVAHFYFLKNIT